MFLETWLPASGQGCPFELMACTGTAEAVGLTAAWLLLVAAAVEDLNWRQSPRLSSMSSMLLGSGRPSRFACEVP